MTLPELAGLISIPITNLITATIIFVTAALVTKKSRMETAKTIQSMNFGANNFSALATLWSVFFQRIFGEQFLAKRQLLSIPLYTLLVSGIFFLIWICYLYLFENPTHSFLVTLPPNVKQSISDFYHKGIIAALVIDIITIQLTRICIRVGNKFGYYSVRFFLMFLVTLVSAYFIFSVSVFFFRIEDMVRLYMWKAPDDHIPPMPYAPMETIESSLRLFYPQTIIHFTTRGVFSTYFMPEPLIFYCAVTGQLSLLIITLAYQIATGLEKVKNFCVGFVKHVGTPQANAASVVFLIFLGLVSMPLIALVIYAIASSK